MQLGYDIVAIFDQCQSLHRMLSMVRPSRVINTVAPDRGKLVTLMAGSSGGVCWSRETYKMFMTRSLNVTPNKTEHNLIVRTGKSEAEVTNNKRLRSTYCSVEANLLTDTKHRAASLRQQSFLLVEIWGFYNLQYGSHPSSWIFIIFIFGLSKSDDFLLKYGDFTIFKMADLRPLEF